MHTNAVPAVPHLYVCNNDAISTLYNIVRRDLRGPSTNECTVAQTQPTCKPPPVTILVLLHVEHTLELVLCGDVHLVQGWSEAWCQEKAPKTQHC